MTNKTPPEFPCPITVQGLLSFKLLALILCAGLSTAEIPQTTQRALQKRAPEKLTIEVQSVAEKKRLTNTLLTVTAKVLSVEESKSGLKEGDTISISYAVPVRVDAGAPPPKVAEDKHYQAFLGAPVKNLLYAPAAASGSFEEVLPGKR